MAGIPKFQKIQVDDLGDPNNPDELPQVVRRLTAQVSLVMETLYEALNKNVTFSENIDSEYKTFTFTTPANYYVGQTTELAGSPQAVVVASEPSGAFDEITLPITLRQRRVSAVFIAQVFEVGSLTSVTTIDPVSVDWYDNGGGEVVIKRISGLENNKQYTVTLLIV